MRLGWMAPLLCLAAAAGQETTMMPQPLRDVGIDQRLNDPVPLELVFTDESGNPRALKELMRGRPAVLALVYYDCPMLCSMQLNGLVRAMRAMPLTAGKDFDVLTVSFDPRDTPRHAAEKKEEYIPRYARAGAEEGWHFLTGSEEAIERLTRAVGYRYKLDPNTGQWAHASGIMVLTPEGRLARYFYGVEYSARDLRLGLVEASRGAIGSPVDQVLLFCFHYDPMTGKYGLIIMNVIRAAGIATVLALCAFWFVMHRRSRRNRMDHVDRLSLIS